MAIRYNEKFKLEVVKAYMNGDRSMSELSADYNVAKSTITGWMKNMVKNANIKINYGQALIEKICRTLYGTTNYFDAVDALYSHGIISNYTLWRDGNYTACNIRDLLVKVASKIDLLRK